MLQKRVVEQCYREALGRSVVPHFGFCGLVLSCGFMGGQETACSSPPESLSTARSAATEIVQTDLSKMERLQNMHTFLICMRVRGLFRFCTFFF